MGFRAVIRNSLTGLEKTFEDAQVCADFLAGEVKELWEGIERLVLPEPTTVPVVAEEATAESESAVVAEPTAEAAAEPVAQEAAELVEAVVPAEVSASSEVA